MRVMSRGAAKRDKLVSVLVIIGIMDAVRDTNPDRWQFETGCDDHGRSFPCQVQPWFALRTVRDEQQHPGYERGPLHRVLIGWTRRRWLRDGCLVK